MATPSVLDRMVAVSERSQVPAVGYFTWFSVPDNPPVSLVALKMSWLIAGLEPSCLPTDPKEIDLFKRAMRAQEGKVVLQGGSIETDVRDVVEDQDFCVYQISRVVKDTDERTVDYPKAMRVVYNKADGTVDFTPLEGATHKVLQPVEDAITAYLHDNAKKIEGRKVRAIVRNYLKSYSDATNVDEHGKMRVTGLGGTNLRGKGGGVYFVKAEWKTKLDALARCLEQLYPGKAAYLYSFPMIDDKDAKAMLEERFTADALNDAEEALIDVAKLLRDDRKNAVRKDVREFWFKRLLLAQERLADYEALIEKEVPKVRFAQETLKRQVEALL